MKVKKDFTHALLEPPEPYIFITVNIGLNRLPEKWPKVFKIQKDIKIIWDKKRINDYADNI